jgi:hypothetical protein
MPITGSNFYGTLYENWNQPYYEYGWNLPYDHGWNYPSYSLGSHYNSSSYTERYALSINQTQPSIIPYGTLRLNQETSYLANNYFGFHSWQIQPQDYLPFHLDYQKNRYNAI